MWLLDRLCAVCDGVGDSDFLGWYYEGHSLEAIKFIAILTCCDRQSH